MLPVYEMAAGTMACHVLKLCPSPTHTYDHNFSHTVFVILLSISQQATGTCVCGKDEESKSCLAVAAPIILFSSGLIHI